MRFVRGLAALGPLWLALLACNMPLIGKPDTAQATVAPTIAGSAATPSPPFDDASAMFSNICDAFLQTLTGKTLVIDNPDELTAFYNSVDDSHLCSDPVNRLVFDFTARQIVGGVFMGQGCSLEVEYQGIQLDDTARQRIISVTAAVSGTCPNKLVRPLWIGIERPRQGYSTSIERAS